MSNSSDSNFDMHIIYATFIMCIVMFVAGQIAIFYDQQQKAKIKIECYNQQTKTAVDLRCGEK
jgi:cbb3-type cytochrome oxidase subunit 3